MSKYDEMQSGESRMPKRQEVACNLLQVILSEKYRPVKFHVRKKRMQLNKLNFSKAPQVLQNSHVPLKSLLKRPNTKFSSVDSCSDWIMIAFTNQILCHIKQCKYRKTGMYVKYNMKHLFLAD